MDADRVAQRAMDLHEKASMPLAEALALAINEAAPSPIWPCAKLVIKGGVVSLESHQYAPGLPDGEHDVYPLPVDSDAEPAPGVMAFCPACFVEVTPEQAGQQIKAARVLAEFAKTAPGRLPSRVQEAIAAVLPAGVLGTVKEGGDGL